MTSAQRQHCQCAQSEVVRLTKRYAKPTLDLPFPSSPRPGQIARLGQQQAKKVNLRRRADDDDHDSGAHCVIDCRRGAGTTLRARRPGLGHPTTLQLQSTPGPG